MKRKMYHLHVRIGHGGRLLGRIPVALPAILILFSVQESGQVVKTRHMGRPTTTPLLCIFEVDAPVWGHAAALPSNRRRRPVEAIAQAGAAS